MAKAENVQATHIATRFDEKVYRRTNARMFKSGFIEAFSKVHPAVPALIFFPLAGYFFYLATETQPLWQLPAGISAGILLWTFAEYTLHRFYFHMTPSNPVKQFLYFYSHGIHHSYPDDYYRLVMVPSISIPLAFAFYSLFAAIFPAAWLASIFAGFVIGYLAYDYVHFATHHVNPPRAAWLAPVAAVMKAQRRRHMKHHYEEHDTGYGVSTVLWDIVFGTKSKTA